MGTFANWSLPTARNQDGSAPCGGYCTGSQMGYLWYEVLGNPFTNTGSFRNVQSTGAYWSGTEYAPSTNAAWFFNAIQGGGQGIEGKIIPLFAVAVRPGDVAAPVPEPQTWAMLLVGFGIVRAALRRRPV